MIVLESVDPRRRRIAVRHLEKEPVPTGDDLAALYRLLSEMGESGVEILDHENSDMSGSLDHEWVLAEDGTVEYRASFPHRRDTAAWINIYTAAALATYSGNVGEHLMQLRLAIYEFCVNSLEHGTALIENCQLRLGLRFEDGVVQGWIQDQCHPFNPLDRPLEDLESLLLRRASRGYGIRLAIQLLDELEYEYNDTGNLLRFRKRIDS